jgi:hypothetical protein
MQMGLRPPALKNRVSDSVGGKTGKPAAEDSAECTGLVGT